MRLIDCWDLDRTLLDTDRLFTPVVERMVLWTGRPAGEIAESLYRVSARTFTFEAWFDDLSLPSLGLSKLKRELEDDLAERAVGCLFSGVLELLEARKLAGVRSVVVTAGNAVYQRWKLELLGLNHIFAREDRHFVPLSGSKAKAIEPYVRYGKVAFMEDTVSWLQQVSDRRLHVDMYRTCWHKPEAGAHVQFDGQLWRVVRTVEELRIRLQGGGV